MSHILVVDDEKSIRLTVGEFLRADGHEVQLAEDADKAMAALKEGDFDVVVSDIILPKVTGVELLKRIRLTSPHVQVILMTGEPTAETASEAVRAGAFDYLFKPIAKDAILKAVTNATVVKSLGDEKRRLEQENRRYRDELEQLVDERTKELRGSNRQLEDALTELKETQQQAVQQERLRALGTMASGIAHDFNNALSPIMGYSELLATQPETLADTERAVELLKVINTAAEDAAETVNRMREFYRPHDQDEFSQPVLVQEAAKRALELTQPRWRDQAQGEGIDIRVETHLARTPLIRGNEADLREAVANLILNAADAMPEGGTLSLGTRAENQEVLIEVSDTGTGMTEETRLHCLEPFYTTKGERGTGLGLAGVYGTVQRHGAVLGIQSELGKGTTFAIRLPLEDDGQVRAVEQDAPLPPSRTLRVLVVEDEPEVSLLIQQQLRLDGHTVEAAADGREGLDTFRSGEFDLVFTDRAMPEMNGDEVAATIKAEAPEMPIIMLTGFGSMMKAAGEEPPCVDAVLGKPISMVDMRRAIAQVMPEQDPAPASGD